MSIAVEKVSLPFFPHPARLEAYRGQGQDCPPHSKIDRDDFVLENGWKGQHQIAPIFFHFRARGAHEEFHLFRLSSVGQAHLEM